MYGWLHRLELSSRLLAPGIVTLFLVLFMVAPRQITGSVEFMPLFALMSIYYWGIFRPDVMPYWFVFIVGLLQDTLLGQPLGISSLLYLLFRWMVPRQRRLFTRQVFGALWLGFVLITATIFLLKWTCLTLFFGRPMGLQPAAMQWVITVGLYPFLHQLFNQIYRLLPHPRNR